MGQENSQTIRRGRAVLSCLAALVACAFIFLSGCAGPGAAAPEAAAPETAGAVGDLPAGGQALPAEEPVCEHRWADGACTLCGVQCSHEWENGTCTLCCESCGHPGHDPLTRVCTLCGSLVPHRYAGGVCSLCGAEPAFVTTTLDDRFYEPVAENAGTIEEVEYDTPRYMSSGHYHKTMTVYLPYNYDPAEKYDVFILCPGLSGRIKWLQRTYTEAGHTMNGKNLLDNMILEGYMKPMIVVVIDTSVGSGKAQMETGDAQIGVELREAVLPTLAERYSTYALDGSYESLVAARAHFGIGGASNGSLYAYAAGCIRNLELFANYVCMSGCTRAPAVRRRLDADRENAYPVCMFCSCAGDIDNTRKKTHDGFYTVIDNNTGFTEGENAFFVQSEGRHDWHVWYTGLFNFLPLLFPEQPAP